MSHANVAPKSHHHTIALALATFIGGWISASVHAQSWITYDAALGTTPQDQCWTLVEQITPPMGYLVGVRAGDLHLSTMAFGNNVPENNGGGVWWQREEVTIDFANDFAVEARVRIASAPDHSINTVTGWPRPGYALVVADIHGRGFWIGLGTSEVFLSNTAYGAYGSANTVTTAFNTTDGPHVYRIERAPGGVGAVLRIDGVIRLEMPSLGPVEYAGGIVYFGDPTYWANSDSYTSMVRYTSVRNCPADIVCDQTVNVTDLLAVISAWGRCPACPADTNGDLAVNVTDLLAVISAWGDCP